MRRESDSTPRGAGLEVVINELNRASKRMMRTGWIVLGTSVLFGVAAAYWLWLITQSAIGVIIDHGDNVLLIVFELVRSAAYAGFVTAIVFALVRLGTACLDQATRYEKRLMAARFMDYLFTQYEAPLRMSTVTLKDVVAILDQWSNTVESAFTRAKIAPSSPGAAMSFSLGQEGMSYSTGDASKKKASAK